jgi:branched-chain amino acid transport system substrate-binding protein
MNLKIRTLVLACAMGASNWGSAQTPAPPANEIVLGDIDDLSGTYADTGGTGSFEAMKMAIADFGGTVLGKKIVAKAADHQNKPDIGASKFREWTDRGGLNMLLGGANTGVSIAMAKVAAAKKVVFIPIGSGGASLSNEDCTAYTIHYVYDTTALANGTATAILESGGKSWFFLTADYAFGTQLQSAATKVIESHGGKILGAVRVPLSTADFSSFLLQAQSSGAQVLALANAGDDFSNSLKAAKEFGLTKQMKTAALLVAISNIHSLGLPSAQGLYLTTAWYWDLNDETRAFAKRYFAVMKKQPTMYQAGYYSATLTYLKALKEAGTTDPDKVMAILKKTKIDDMFTHGGYVRADGVMVHSMYVMQVKTPQESKYPWDYYKVLKIMNGEDSFGPITGLCPLAPK